MRIPNKSYFARAGGLTLILAATVSTGRAQQAPPPPLTKAQVLHLLKNYVSPAKVAEWVRERKINFQVTPEIEQEIRQAGGDDELMEALRAAAPKPAAPAPTAPTTAAAPLATLLIEGTPGAHVYLDDAPVGTTSPEGNLRVPSLTAGVHRLRLSVDGYSDYEKQIGLSPGQNTSVVVTLERVGSAASTGVSRTQRESEQGQGANWVGTWAFGGGVEASSRCQPRSRFGKFVSGGAAFSTLLPALLFRTFEADGSPSTRAEVYGLPQARKGGDRWLGKPGEATLRLTLDPAPAATPFNQGKLERMSGSLEASRRGDQFAAQFAMSVAYLAHHNLECEVSYKYSGPIRRVSGAVSRAELRPQATHSSSQGATSGVGVTYDVMHVRSGHGFATGRLEISKAGLRFEEYGPKAQPTGNFSASCAEIVEAKRNVGSAWFHIKLRSKNYNFLPGTYPSAFVSKGMSDQILSAIHRACAGG